MPVMYVGDDPLTDVAGARSAGLQAVLLDRAHEGRASDGVTSIRSLTELPAMLSGAISAADGGSSAAGCRS